MKRKRRRHESNRQQEDGERMIDLIGVLVGYAMGTLGILSYWYFIDERIDKKENLCWLEQVENMEREYCKYHNYGKAIDSRRTA
jgi:hypothetical protein